VIVDKSWAAEEVVAAQAAAELEGLPYDDPTGPVYQWDALHRLDQLQADYGNGDQAALFAALRVCAGHGLQMPAWASRAFIDGYDQVLNCHVGSWDEAFGRPYPKGKQLGRMREARRKRPAVYLMICSIRSREPRTPIDDALFERVGSRLGLGKTRTGELYYEARKLYGYG
jgi:hypothetical protein